MVGYPKASTPQTRPLGFLRLGALRNLLLSGARDEAWRIAANIAKLPDLLQRPTGVTNEAMLAICERVAEVQALLHDYLEAGKQTKTADVIAEAQAVLSESELLRAMFDVGYFPANLVE